MAITIVGQPDKFSPVFNPTYFYANSTNRNEINFRYVVDLYYAGTSERFQRYELKPAPITGNGVADVNQVLANQLGYYYNQSLTGFSSTPQNFIDYDVTVGERYLTQFRFSATTGNPLSATTTLKIASGQTHPFVSGDRIAVVPDVDPYYSGVYTVTATTTTGVTIYKTTSGNSTTQGSISYADGRSTYFTGATLTGYSAFNGAVRHEDLITYTSSTYNIKTGSTGNLLTSVPNNFYVRLTNSMFLNLYTTTNTKIKGFIVVTNNGSYLINNTFTGSTKMLTIACGPKDIMASPYTVLDGPTTIFSDDIINYNIYIVDVNDNQISNAINFMIDRRCYRYDNIELMFMDKLGSFSTINFQLQNTRRININKTIYQTTLGGLTGGRWGFSSTDGGKNVIDIKVTEELDLVSDFVPSSNLRYYRELYESPVVYLKERGKFWPVIVKTDNLILPTALNKKNNNFKITIQYANNDSTQRF